MNVYLIFIHHNLCTLRSNKKWKSNQQLWIQLLYIWLFFSCYCKWNTIKYNKEKCNVNILLYPNVNLQYTYENTTKIWWIFTSLFLIFNYLRWEKIQNQTRIFKNTSSFSETNQIKNILKYWYFALRPLLFALLVLKIILMSVLF